MNFIMLIKMICVINLRELQKSPISSVMRQYKINLKLSHYREAPNGTGRPLGVSLWGTSGQLGTKLWVLRNLNKQSFSDFMATENLKNEQVTRPKL